MITSIDMLKYSHTPFSRIARLEEDVEQLKRHLSGVETEMETDPGLVDHGALTGLGKDHHLQYLHLSIARTVAVNHTIASGHGFIFEDADTVGQMLRWNGTIFVPSMIQATDLPGDFGGFNNPSASIGLSTVNGTATTAMRSDAAPALSQAIAPTWTALHTFNAGLAIAAGQYVTFGGDATLGRSAANVVSVGTGDRLHAPEARFSTGITVGSNTAAASASEILMQATDIDAQIRFHLNAASRWAFGVDQSDSYKLKIEVGGTLGGGNPPLCMTTDGQIGIYTGSPAAWFHIYQHETAAAVSVLRLQQADEDKAMIDFVGTSSATVPLTYTLVDDDDVGTATPMAWVRCYLYDEAARITAGTYWLPLYTLTV